MENANWCAPCKKFTPALEQMAATDAEIVLRKIDVTNPGPVEEQFNIQALPHVKVYNRGASLVGLDVEKVKSYVAQRRVAADREVSRHARAYANRASTSATLLNWLESSFLFVSSRGYVFLITYFRFRAGG